MIKLKVPVVWSYHQYKPSVTTIQTLQLATSNLIRLDTRKAKDSESRKSISLFYLDMI